MAIATHLHMLYFECWTNLGAQILQYRFIDAIYGSMWTAVGIHAPCRLVFEHTTLVWRQLGGWYMLSARIFYALNNPDITDEARLQKRPLPAHRAAMHGKPGSSPFSEDCAQHCNNLKDFASVSRCQYPMSCPHTKACAGEKQLHQCGKGRCMMPSNYTWMRFDKGADQACGYCLTCSGPQSPAHELNPVTTLVSAFHTKC